MKQLNEQITLIEFIAVSIALLLGVWINRVVTSIVKDEFQQIILICLIIILYGLSITISFKKGFYSGYWNNKNNR